MIILSTLACTLILIGLYILIDILFSNQVFWVKNICFGIFGFFSAFLIISLILFAFDIYTFWLTYGLCFALGAIIILVNYFRSYRTETVENIKKLEKIKDFPQYFMPCLIGLLVLGTVITCSKFELYGMGRDQGVYQATVFFRIAEYNSVQIDLDSYHALEYEQDKQLYIEATEAARHNAPGRGNLLGFNLDSHNHYMYYEPLSEVSGYMHGLPNYSALLSISSRIFGFSGMWHIHTLFFLASIGLLLLTLCYNLKLRLLTSTLITGLFAISPVVLWTTKSSFTECFITLIMTVFLYLITSDAKCSRRLLWLPVSVFAFYHVSVFTFMPMFIVLFIILYIQKRDINIIISGVISVIAYLLGFFAMFFTSNGYTIGNYHILRKVSSAFVRAYDGTIVMVCIASVAAILLLILTYFLIKKFDIKINPKVFLIIIKYATIVSLIHYLYMWIVRYFQWEIPPDFSLLHIRGLVSSSSESTFVVFAFLSGFIILPIVMFGIFAKKKVFAEKNVIPITITFFYCIIFYSVFMRREVHEYYYFTRYLALLIPTILVMGGVYIDGFKVKARVVILALSLLLTAPFSLFVIFNKDTTRVDWAAFEQVVSAVDELDENDVVIVSTDELRNFFLPLEALTDVIILPEIDGDYRIVAEKLENPGNGNVYVLSRGGRVPLGTNEYLVFETWRSNYINMPGLIPPLPIQVNYDDSLLRLDRYRP